MQYKDLTENLKKQIIDDYTINKLTKKQIREKYTIGQKLCNKVLKDIPLNRFYYYNTYSAIDIIWDKLYNPKYANELGYWMGFLMADGSVHKTSYKKSYTLTVALSLSIIDENIIRKYAFFWTENHSIHLTKNALYKNKNGSITKESLRFKFSITRNENEFKKYGLIPNKTYTFLEPQINDNIVLKNYLRGWFDGDGCVYIHLKYKERVQVTGMPVQVKWFLNKLIYLGYNGSYNYSFPIKTSQAIQLRICGNNNIKKFYDILKPNDNEEYMPRKWETLKNHITRRIKS